MAVLTVQTLGAGGDIGAALTLTPAVGGATDTFANTGNEFLMIKTAAAAPAGSVTVLGVPSEHGIDGSLVVPTTAIGKTIIVGPFKAANFSKANGDVDVSYLAGTNASVALFRGA